MRTASIDQVNMMKENVEYFLTDVEKKKFNIASQLEGNLKKKSPSLFKGWQKRFFAIKCK